MTDTDTATSMATTEDWAKLEKAAQEWGSFRCLLDLRRRVEALEARAATEESSATDVDSALLRTGMVTAHHLATIREALPPKPAPAPEPAQEWIERRIYKNSIEYSEYIKQRFQDRTSSSFEFDGHRWQYEHSSFDDTGEYDLISRPPAPKPAPAPAADRPLWKVMREAWNDSGTFDFSAAHRYAAEIDAVADWLAAREHCGAASALRIEARRAREGA